MILDAHGTVICGSARVIHSVVLEDHIAVIIGFGVQNHLEFFQRSVVSRLDGILIVSVVPLHDKAVIFSIVPVEDAHIGKDIHAGFADAGFFAFEVVPIRRQEGLRTKRSGDIVVIKVRIVAGDKGNPAIG